MERERKGFNDEEEEEGEDDIWFRCFLCFGGDNQGRRRLDQEHN